MIGDYDKLLVGKLLYERRRNDLNTSFLTFYAVFFVFCLIMYISGVRDRGYLAFTLVAFIYLFGYLLGRDIFYEFKSTVVQRLIFSLTALLPASFLFFLKETFKEDFSFYVKLLAGLLILLAVVLLFPMSVSLHKMASLVWSLLTVQVMIVSVHYTIRALNIKKAESQAHLLGVFVLSLGVIFWIAEGFLVIIPVNLYGYTVADFTMPLAMLCFIYAVDKRFATSLKMIKTFADKILISQEEERKRISRDIHDGVGQSLMSVKLKLQMFNTLIPEEKEKERKELAGIIDNVSTSIQELRDISANIRPSFLENMSLADILRWYAEKFQIKTGISVNIDIQDEINPLPCIVKENIYRILQEALGNVLKHSGADCVSVLLSKNRESLLMKIDDNGRGFDMMNSKARQGLGLNTMKERAELLGGSIDIYS
ncbi:MAG: sensor histidine kinase, partial [Deltaproteobacteria bacterium]|nr:sensor histidine kinase [Deltaproteobacteria bacterium]